MQPISIYDEITIDVGVGEGIRVSCDSASVPSNSTNLAYKAAAVFLESTGSRKSIDISIKKNVPVAAGLGGGSSNAATVLMALDSIFKTGLGEKVLMDMAATLGSDVPFFILRGSAVATGRGEVLERVKLPGYEYVLVNPGFPVSTAWVYNNLDLTKKPENNILFYSEEALTSHQKLREFLVNDLEAVTIRKYPEVLRLKEMLLESGATAALMSGSGPTVFGVFQDSVTADAALKGLKCRLDKSVAVFRAKGL